MGIFCDAGNMKRLNKRWKKATYRIEAIIYTYLVLLIFVIFENHIVDDDSSQCWTKVVPINKYCT